MVKISISCKNEIKKIDIDDSLFSEERDMLEDLLPPLLMTQSVADKRTQEACQADIRTEFPGMKLPF